MGGEATFQEELAEVNRKGLEAVRGFLGTGLRNAGASSPSGENRSHLLGPGRAEGVVSGTW
jgi:hypothetical protein